MCCNVTTTSAFLLMLSDQLRPFTDRFKTPFLRMLPLILILLCCMLDEVGVSWQCTSLQAKDHKLENMQWIIIPLHIGDPRRT